jgi:hypothetical protein
MGRRLPLSVKHFSSRPPYQITRREESFFSPEYWMRAGNPSLLNRNWDGKTGRKLRQYRRFRSSSLYKVAAADFYTCLISSFSNQIHELVGNSSIHAKVFTCSGKRNCTAILLPVEKNSVTWSGTFPNRRHVLLQFPLQCRYRESLTVRKTSHTEVKCSQGLK